MMAQTGQSVLSLELVRQIGLCDVLTDLMDIIMITFRSKTWNSSFRLLDSGAQVTDLYPASTIKVAVADAVAFAIGFSTIEQQQQQPAINGTPTKKLPIKHLLCCRKQQNCRYTVKMQN